jgi:hypothetical protein
MSLHYIRSKSGGIFETNNPTIWTGNGMLEGEQLPKAEGKRLYQEQAKDNLLQILSHGDTVYCVLRKVSASGMSRTIDFYVIKENRPIWLSGYMAVALGWKRAKDRGITISGCGMDMGFHAVYCLAAALWSKGNPNREDKDGGYFLKSEWM